MNYEIPAGTAQLINKSKEIAQEYVLLRITPLCLLLSILDNEYVVQLLNKINIKVDSLIDEVKSQINVQNSKTNEGTKDDELMSSAPSTFDTDSTRILHLLTLEDKLAQGKKSGAEIILLSILHDRQNEAKSLLLDRGVSYEKIQSANSTAASPSDDFSFPNEDDMPYPNDDFSKGDETSQQTAERKTPKSNSDTPIVDNFGTDLTAVAAKGGLDPVVGREEEIQRVVQILCRRKKNNPIIIGAPGVGKSAIVEGLADRIAHHHVPHLLQNKRIVALDMASIVAGTQYRGQFEERLRRLIKELKSHPEIVLFIDEIHTIIGAGSAPGSLDAANILKPALARGEVQCIGATTTGEFKKTIEKDGALDRRFQKVSLEPTSPEETLCILHNIKERYEKHHVVNYTEEALKACVDLTRDRKSVV